MTRYGTGALPWSYPWPSPRANPEKTQISAFHLKNRETDRQLRIRWYGKWLTHSHKAVYLGVTLDRSLAYKDHIANTKAKVSSRNSIHKKLANTKWGTDASTIRTTALALCFSAAEYASPVWSRSAHAAKIDTVLNDACRVITWCLKPTRVDDLYLLSGIAPPYIRRTVLSEKEKNKQETDPLHPLFQQEPAVKRLKSRKSFLHLVEPLQVSPHNRGIALWSAHLQNAPHKSPLIPRIPSHLAPVRHGPFGYVLTAWELQQVDANLSCRGGDTMIVKQLVTAGRNRLWNIFWSALSSQIHVL